MNIRKKFVILVILLTTIPVIITTTICISSFNKKYMYIIEQNVLISAQNQSTNLKKFFEQCLIDIKVIINMPLSKSLMIDSNNEVNSKKTEYNRDIVNQFLEGYRKEEVFLNSILLINKSGTTIATSDNEYIGKNIQIPKDGIEKLLNDEVFVTNIISKKEFNNGKKSVIIVKPIFYDNKYEGAILSLIDMTYFTNLINEVNFFENGKTIIIDGNGNIAATTNKNITGNVNNIVKENTLIEEWNKIDFNNNPSGIINYTLDGTKEIGYYSKIADTQWVVLSVVEWSEFIIQIKQNVKAILMLLLFILTLIVISYIFIINYFSNPLYKLLDSIKKIKNGNYINRFIYNKSNEFGEIAISFNKLIDQVSQHKEEIEYINRRLKLLIDNIPGGVYRCRLENGEYVIDFINQVCIQILGYSKDYIGHNLFNVIYEKDKNRVCQEILSQLSEDDKFNVEYRIVRKDGSIIWVLDNGQKVITEKGEVFTYSVIVDITEAKIAQEQLRLSEERHCIIMNQTEDIIFELDINKDRIIYCDNWFNKFEHTPIKNNFKEELYKSEIVYIDDIEKLKQSLERIEHGSEYEQIEIRIKGKEGKYIWCKIRATTIFNDNANVVKVIGVIIDIDEEKRKNEILLFKAERDSLTELYNKGISEKLIENYIEGDGKNGNHALFVIDIDDFKVINDNLGHLFGDAVLQDISLILKNIFRKDDIVGRIGGDEFIALLKDINSEELIIQKADELVKSFGKRFVGDELNYKISGSIGIAQYPMHGKNFKELFENADKALYLAKNKGKDSYYKLEN